MSQYQAPPTPAESVDLEDYRGPIPRPFKVWSDDIGWCSACLDGGRRIVFMGTAERFVGLCSYCLARLADEMRSPLAGNTGRDGNG